jgi:hypothetical protein
MHNPAIDTENIGNMDEIKLLKEELEYKFKIINKSFSETSQKLEAKTKLISEYESKIKNMKKIIEEKNSMIFYRVIELIN